MLIVVDELGSTTLVSVAMLMVNVSVSSIISSSTRRTEKDRVAPGPAPSVKNKVSSSGW